MRKNILLQQNDLFQQNKVIKNNFQVKWPSQETNQKFIKKVTKDLQILKENNTNLNNIQ